MPDLKCNIDADIVAYEVASSGQFINEEGELVIRSYFPIYDYVKQRVDEILEGVGSTQEPTLFFTGDNNFRHELATVKEYKGNRKDEDKPFHLKNVQVVMQSMYPYVISKDAEADDELSIAQTEDTCLCSRDKDLKQCEGWGYGWESGLQPERKLHHISELGYIEGEYEEGVSEKTGKPFKRFISKSLKGEGYLWFLAQLVTGDVVDNIPGLEKAGAKAAYEALIEKTSKQEGLDAVTALYKKKYGDSYEERLNEQARLLWMIRERDENGELVMWDLKENNYAQESSKDKV